MQLANFTQANLEGLDLKGLSTHGCDFRGAILRNTKGYYNISKADFRDADLRGAHLTGAVDYTGNSALFAGAEFDKGTVWPNGFDVQGSGGKLDNTAIEPAKPAPAGKTASAKKRKKSWTDPAAKPTEPPQPAAAKALDPNRPAAAPTEADVKNAFEKMWTENQVLKNTFTCQSMKFGPPRQGDALQDGTPANVRTIVVPVTLACEQVITYNDNTTRTKQRTQTFFFYKGESGAWVSQSILNR